MYLYVNLIFINNNMTITQKYRFVFIFIISTLLKSIYLMIVSY